MTNTYSPAGTFVVCPVKVYSFPPEANAFSVHELMLMPGRPCIEVVEDEDGDDGEDGDDDEDRSPITATTMLASAAMTATITDCH
jgi:hypothetical protein